MSIGIDQTRIRDKLISIVPEGIRPEIYDTEFYSNFSSSLETLAFAMKFKYKGQVLSITANYMMLEDQEALDGLRNRLSFAIQKLDEMEEQGLLRTSIRPRNKEYIT